MYKETQSDYKVIKIMYKDTQNNSNNETQNDQKQTANFSVSFVVVLCLFQSCARAVAGGPFTCLCQGPIVTSRFLPWQQVGAPNCTFKKNCPFSSVQI